MSGTALDAAKSLRVNVKHVARCCMLVTLNRFDRIEKAQPSKTCCSAHTSHGRRAGGSNAVRNLPHGHSCLSQLHDPRSLLSANLFRLILRSRATVFEWLVGYGSSSPLARSANAHPRCPCRCAERPSLILHPLYQQRSTRGQTSRILVYVHPGSSVRSVRLEGFQIRRSRLDGQLLSGNNLLRHHN